MQIVINISEETYQKIKNDEYTDVERYCGMLSIANGTPLPKGHGRLIDADAFVDNYEECGWIDDIKVNEFNAITPTIIEADKGDK